MIPEPLVERLTHRVTVPRTGTTYVAVRPGLGLAMYYGLPLHEMAGAIDRIVDAYLRFVPQGAIAALCGMSAWGPYSRERLQRQLKKLRSKERDHANIDLSSGSLLASEGPYGWHLNGGSMSNTDTWPNNTNVCYHELPHDEIERTSARGLVDWAVSVAEIHPFDTGQLGHSFNKLQRTWTGAADEFVGGAAMRFRGFDILEPQLARETRGFVPNCSWLNFLGETVIRKLGGEGAIRGALSSAVLVRQISGGLLLQAGELPPIGDMNRGGTDLGPVQEVARLTMPARLMRKVLFYGTEEFRNGWLHRFDP